MTVIDARTVSSATLYSSKVDDLLHLSPIELCFLYGQMMALPDTPSTNRTRRANVVPKLIAALAIVCQPSEHPYYEELNGLVFRLSRSPEGCELIEQLLDPELGDEQRMKAMKTAAEQLKDRPVYDVLVQMATLLLELPRRIGRAAGDLARSSHGDTHGYLNQPGLAARA